MLCQVIYLALIYSRPLKHNFFEYRFYVHWNLPAAAAAVEAQHLGLLDDEELVEASNNATVAAVAAAAAVGEVDGEGAQPQWDVNPYKIPSVHPMIYIIKSWRLLSSLFKYCYRATYLSIVPRTHFVPIPS